MLCCVQSGQITGATFCRGVCVCVCACSVRLLYTMLYFYNSYFLELYCCSSGYHAGKNPNLSFVGSVRFMNQYFSCIVLSLSLSLALSLSVCVCESSLKKGQIISISRRIPQESPFQSYAEFQNHWNNLVNIVLLRL